MDLEEIKKFLIKEKEETEKFLKEIDEEIEKLKTSDEFEASDISEQFEEKQEFHIKKDILLEKLKNIDKALKKIEEGSYGICSICKKEIPIERLEINPLTETCVKCSQKE